MVADITERKRGEFALIASEKRFRETLDNMQEGYTILSRDLRYVYVNAAAGAGYPLLANGQSAPFSPLFLATLFVPLPDQIVAMAGLKIFLALVFGCKSSPGDKCIGVRSECMDDKTQLVWSITTTKPSGTGKWARRSKPRLTAKVPPGSRPGSR